MSPNDQAGRIHKTTFVVSNLVLFALCLVAACVRFYIRFRVQKQVSIDDGFLLFGICCLITVEALLYTFIDSMYMTEALLFENIKDVELPPDFIQRAFDYQKMAAITLGLTWFAIFAVKFSFLFLFRKLIDRLKPLIIYWRVAVLYNVGVLVYGTLVYYFACPHFYSTENFSCTEGPGKARTINYALSQMVLDIVGDLMILFIPIRLIWKVQIRWVQKLALASSLCLTAVVIVVTVIRVSGLSYEGKVDSIWETYWLIIGGEVGIILTAATAFRAFFVSRTNERMEPTSRGNNLRWYAKSKRLLKRTFTPRSWRSKSFSEISRDSSEASPTPRHEMELPQIPRPMMTGIRTFISGRGKTPLRSSQIMGSVAVEEDGDEWPLSGQRPAPRIITVQHDITSKSERVSRDTLQSRRDGDYGDRMGNNTQVHSQV